MRLALAVLALVLALGSSPAEARIRCFLIFCWHVRAAPHHHVKRPPTMHRPRANTPASPRSAPKQSQAPKERGDTWEYEDPGSRILLW